MRVLILAFALTAAFATSNACAQSPPSPLISQFMSHKDIMALIDKAKADRKPNAAVTAEQVVRLASYHAQVEYRPGNAPAAVHEKDAEFMLVLQGTGSIVTRGQVGQ